MSFRRQQCKATAMFLPCLLLLLTVSAYSIPFSAVFRRTQSLLLRIVHKKNNHGGRKRTSFMPPTMDYPPDIQKSISSTLTRTTNTVYSLLGGFADAQWTNTNHKRPSSSTSLQCTTINEQDTTAVEATTTTTTPSSTTNATTTELPQDHRASAHLQLKSAAMMASLKTNQDGVDALEKSTSSETTATTTTREQADSKSSPSSQQTTAQLHTYHDAMANVSLSGLNVSKRKFAAWVRYTLYHPQKNPQQQQANKNNNKKTMHSEMGIEDLSSLISTQQVSVDDLQVRQRLRTLWRQGRLLTDRTELLAIYKSEQQAQQQQEDDSVSKSISESMRPKKRGGFSDLLHIYAERLSAIIQDETEEFHNYNDKNGNSNSSTRRRSHHDTSRQQGKETPVASNQVMETIGSGLLGWLEREYGEDETRKLCFAAIKDMNVKEQYEVFQHFLEWFRSRFPYYYDRCDSCGASAKDDPDVVHDATLVAEKDGKDNESNDDDDDDDTGTFLGYVYPSDQELEGKASRTEIYQCHKCGSFTRFPRYNAAYSVIEHRRGRCGEYSMLLYRILRATGHTCRWIVDWADHVWAEVRLNGKWVHLDPCEAAVNRPLLYEEWGKQQTYIVAFHAPLAHGGSLDRTCIRRANDDGDDGESGIVPLIEDVTLRYTSADWKDIQKRRDESEEELREFVDRTIDDLEKRLERILQER